MHRKMKKSVLSRNLSQFFNEKDHVQEQECLPSMKIKSVNLSSINSHAIKQFLFIDDQTSEETK